MLLNLLILGIGLVLVIKGADWLVGGASSIARKSGISESIIGLTVIGFGTSSPELFVNVFASFHNEAADIVVGNVIGSNLFNLFLILGIAGLISPLLVQRDTIRKEIPISLLATLLVLILANDQFLFHQAANQIGRWDGILLICLFFAFLYYVFKGIGSSPTLTAEQAKMHSSWKEIVMLVAGLAILLLGSQLVVQHAVEIAKTLGVSSKLIGLTIVSAGTSLPELVTTIVAAKKGHTDLAIGNIVGSNIFNVLLILGASATIKPVSYNLDFNIDSWILIAGTLFLFLVLVFNKKGRLDRWASFCLFVGYLVYLVYLIQKNN